MRGTHQGASIEGSDKVEYCSVPLGAHVVGESLVAITLCALVAVLSRFTQAISTLYEHGERVMLAWQRRKVPPMGW